MDPTLDGGPDNDPFVGREIAGKYRVQKRLGSGGMGAVYKAQHSGTGGDVAVKFLHGTALGDENAIRRFQLEAKNVAALRHANTVRVIDFGVDHGTFYLVMEYLDGQVLSDVLQLGGPMPWARAVHVLRQVLKSLWEAHEHPMRIIHRDIKPANIFLVDLPGEPDHVRVLDFGVSRALTESGAGTQGLLGTPFYMAPELWKGEPVDARTDLYALGCVAYQALAGVPPFVPPPSATDSIYPLLSMHINDRARPLKEARPGVPAPLAAWVERMLAKVPADRPPSARVALEALDHAARESEKIAPTTRRIGPPSEELPRVTPAAVVASAPPAALATATVQRPRRGWPAWATALIAAGVIGAIVAFAVSQTPGPPAAGPSGPGGEVPAAIPGATPKLPAAALPGPAAALPGPAAGLPGPAATHDAFGGLVLSYRARLSAVDHLDEDGTSLDDAAAVVTLDRRRYHAGVGDPEDGWETVFKDDEMQGKLYQLVDGFVDAGTRRAILEGRPLVEVAIYERGISVRVIGQ